MNQTRQIEPEVITAQRLHMLEVLDTLGHEHAIGARTQAFLQRALAVVSLPLTEAQCDRWLRVMCRHEDGSDYAKSQRAVFVRELNRVFEAWYQHDLTAERFCVHNYRRDRQYGLLDVEALEYVTVSEVDALKQQFLRELTDIQVIEDKAKRLRRAFHHFVFAAITFGSMAWTGVFSDLARLQWRHLRTAAQGYLLIPRWGTEQHIFISPVVALCAPLIGEHLPHHHRARQPHPDQPIWPGLSLERRTRSARSEMASDDTEIEGKDSPPAIAAARVRFNQWLGELYRRSHIHTHASCVGSISVQMLAAVSRQYVAEIYTPPVAGALLGLVPYAPVPGPQMEIFASYRQRTADTGTQANDEPSRRITRNSSTTGPAQSNFISSEDETNEFLATRLVHALRPLFEEGRASRQSAIRQLGDLARDLVRQVGYGVEADPISLQKIYAERLMSADVVLSDVARFNVACLALWLAYLCANTKLDRDTVVARRSDAFVLLRLFRGLCLNELEDEDGYELAGLDRAASSLCRLIGTWRQLHTFLSKELKVPVSSVDWKEFTIERTQQPVNLLGQNGFEKLQAALHSAETTAYAAGQHTKALEYHNAALAANLAYYFGARLNEAVRLTVSDVVLRSQQPYICIWRSKRGKSRVVYALHVPVGVVEELKHERDQRYAVSHDLSAPLLVGDNGEAIDGQVISQRVIETLEQLQRRGEEDAMPVVFHTLRHEFANRLMVLEVPLLDIANSMGHASPDTTTGSYLHCFDFLQREQLQGHLACTGEEVALSAKALGARLGVGRTAVLALIRRYEKATGRSVAFIAGMDKNTLKPALEMGVGRCDRQVIPYNEIVRLLAWRLGES